MSLRQYRACGIDSLGWELRASSITVLCVQAVMILSPSLFMPSLYSHSNLKNFYITCIHSTTVLCDMVRPTDRPDAMFLCASFSPSPLHISRDTIRDKGSWTSPKKRGSVVPLSRTRQGKPGFTECWRERRASETADGGEIINGSHHWCFTALLIIHSHFISFIIH